MKKFLAALVVTALPVIANAEALSKPSGGVILTVAGDISNTNIVGPMKELDELFFAKHEVVFSKAAEFDFDMLNALESASVTFQMPGWDKPSVIEGPTLQAYLDAIGATDAKTVTFLAMDGWQSDIDVAEEKDRGWIVGIKRDGRPLDIGRQGPIWAVYPTANVMAAEEEYVTWPWGVFYSEIE